MIILLVVKFQTQTFVNYLIKFYKKINYLFSNKHAYCVQDKHHLLFEKKKKTICCVSSPRSNWPNNTLPNAVSFSCRLQYPPVFRINALPPISWSLGENCCPSQSPNLQPSDSYRTELHFPPRIIYSHFIFRKLSSSQPSVKRLFPRAESPFIRKLKCISYPFNAVNRCKL